MEEALVNYPTGTMDVSFQYDALNRVTTMVDATGTTTYTYANGLLQSENDP